MTTTLTGDVTDHVTHPTPDTAEHVIDIPLDRLAAHPRNVRRSLGDLRDLTRSIRDRGVETPLLVLPADGAGVHHIVAGHRRRAAAEAAGKPTVPCIVRTFTDEADIVLAMLAENTQRSDGLNVVDEAQALAAVIDLRGGTVSARRLATATGHSEGWVRTRLSLLALPDSALDALHDARITLDIATALTSLAEWPDVIDGLVTSGDGHLTTWQVDAARRSQLVSLAVTDSRQRLEHSGTTVVTEDDWQANHRTWKTLDDARLDPDDHHPEPCHAVVVKARYDATVVEIPICTEPRRHTGRNPDSPLVTPAPVRDEHSTTEAADRKERRQATYARTAWVTERLAGRPLPAGEVLGFAVLTWIDTAGYQALQRAAGFLGLDPGGDNHTDYHAVLLAHAANDARKLTAAALALSAACCEDRAHQSLTTPGVARYLDAIERWGYQPTDWEHTQRLTATSADAAPCRPTTGPSDEARADPPADPGPPTADDDPNGDRSDDEDPSDDEPHQRTPADEPTDDQRYPPHREDVRPTSNSDTQPTDHTADPSPI